MKALISIGGDFCVSHDYVADELFSEELLGVFKKPDLNILNLECPVVENNTDDKIIKTGPHLHTTGEVFALLKKLNIHAVTLANNHILDYGEKGIETTIEGCNRNNIRYTGAGRNLAEASLPLITEVNNLKIAIVNFCENEWSVASGKSGGANPMNLIDNLKQIKNARQQADFVLVIIHGGHEIYNLPSPRMVKEYRFFAENGADAVIGHHPHYISGYEVHHNVPIFYSLGNFLFTMKTPYEGWYKGLVVQLEVEKNKVNSFNIIPVVQDKSNFSLSIPELAKKEDILNEVENYAAVIGDDALLAGSWEQFVQKKYRNLNLLSPLNALPGRYFKAGLTRIGLNKLLMRRSYLKEVLNHLRCEAHRDILISLLQKKMTG